MFKGEIHISVTFGKIDLEKKKKNRRKENKKKKGFISCKKLNMHTSSFVITYPGKKVYSKY